MTAICPFSLRINRHKILFFLKIEQFCFAAHFSRRQDEIQMRTIWCVWTGSYFLLISPWSWSIQTPNYTLLMRFSQSMKQAEAFYKRHNHIVWSFLSIFFLRFGCSTKTPTISISAGPPLFSQFFSGESRAKQKPPRTQQLSEIFFFFTLLQLLNSHFTSSHHKNQRKWFALASTKSRI